MKKSILHTEVSLFKNYRTPTQNSTIDLLGWLTTDAFKDEVLQIRASNSADEIKALKSSLPAITPSGIFSLNRSVESLVAHSGFICVDIDGKENPNITNWENQKENFSHLAEIAYSGLSASGNGLFVLVHIEDPKHHADYFRTLETYFLIGLQIKIDKSCKDVSRLRGASYDPNPYINHEAKALTLKLREPKRNFNNQNPAHFQKGDDAAAIMGILNEIKQQNLDLTQPYGDWFKIGAVIANSMGENGRKVFHEFSQYSSKYDPKECDKQFNACLKRKYRYGVGTLKFLLKKVK